MPFPQKVSFAYYSHNIKFHIDSVHNVIWVSLSDIAQATERLVHHWTDKEETQEYIRKLGDSVGIQPVVTRKGLYDKVTEVWGVEEAAIEFAGRCDKELQQWVRDMIEVLQSNYKLPASQKPAEVIPPEISEADLFTLRAIELGVDLARDTHDRDALNMYSELVKVIVDRLASR